MNMKNFYLILVIVCVFFYLTACQSSDRDNRYDSSNADIDKPISQDTTAEDNKLNENTVDVNEYASSFSELQIENLETIYKSDNCEVVTFDYSGPIKYCYSEWKVMTDQIAYEENSLIVTGSVSNVRQATVSRMYNGSYITSYITLFDLRVTDVLLCDAGTYEIGDTVTMATCYNLMKYDEGLPLIEEGKDYLIFCFLASEHTNSMELEKYVDCWIFAPLYLLLERIGNYYLTLDYFSDVNGSLSLSEVLKLTEDDITNISQLPNDEAIVKKYIENNKVSTYGDIESDVEEALYVLKTRTMNNSGELLILAERSFLVNSNELETYVRNKATEYNK